MNIIKYISLIIFAFLLTSCGTMSTECTTLSADRDAYRQCMANQGDGASQYELGMAAFEGQDYQSAISWFKRASRPRTGNLPLYAQEPTIGNRRNAPFDLANNGPATAGHQGAQRMLVRIYEEGIGVEADPKEAQRYREMINPEP